MIINNNDLEKIHKIHNEALIEIDKICNKHNIKYFLSDGTLLGAIRHKGFIPWDDDLDIGMLRNEYIKFQQVVESELSNKYFFQTYYTDKYYSNYFPKILVNNTSLIEDISKKSKKRNGIFVDIFIYDKIIENKVAQKLHFKKFSLFMNALQFKNRYYPKIKFNLKSLFRHFLFIVFSLHSRKYLINKIESIVQEYNNSNSQLYTKHIDNYYNDQVYFHVYNNLTTTKFEGKDFPIPLESSIILKALYGNYMELPPVEQRTTTHGIIYYDISNC